MAKPTQRLPLKYSFHTKGMDDEHPTLKECEVIEYDDGTYLVTNFTMNTSNTLVSTGDEDVKFNSEKEAEGYAWTWIHKIN